MGKAWDYLMADAQLRWCAFHLGFTNQIRMGLNHESVEDRPRKGSYTLGFGGSR